PRRATRRTFRHPPRRAPRKRAGARARCRGPHAPNAASPLRNRRARRPKVASDPSSFGPPQTRAQAPRGCVKSFARPPQPRRRSPFRHAEQRRDLESGHALELEEHEHRAKLLGKLIEHGVQAFAVAALLEGSLGIGTRARELVLDVARVPLERALRTPSLFR